MLKITDTTAMSLALDSPIIAPEQGGATTS